MYYTLPNTLNPAIVDNTVYVNRGGTLYKKDAAGSKKEMQDLGKKLYKKGWDVLIEKQTNKTYTMRAKIGVEIDNNDNAIYSIYPFNVGVMGSYCEEI